MSDDLFLDNSCMAVLPSLLNKTKTRTTRKAYHNEDKHIIRGEFKGTLITDKGLSSFNKLLHEKPAQFKVGDVIKMYWNKGSESNLFCKTCGKGLIKDKFWDAKVREAIEKVRKEYTNTALAYPGMLITKIEKELGLND